MSNFVGILAISLVVILLWFALYELGAMNGGSYKPKQPIEPPPPVPKKGAK